MSDHRTDRIVRELHRLATTTNPNVRNVNKRIRQLIRDLHTHRELSQEVECKSQSSFSDQFLLPLLYTVPSS
ncbi:MAG TPA: hypothetical protein DCG72_09000 [Gammaproteobacteria bacterium]|jgi:hypothetical protein|nr:hypothetical protein [Gammaproteobacteria bacterium]